MAVHPIVRPQLNAFGMLLHKTGIQRHQIHALIAGRGNPSEVVDAGDSGVQVLPLHAGNVLLLIQHRAQHLLRAEYLVAAAERLHLREYLVQRPHAKRHRVRIVDDERVRREVANRFGNLNEHRNRAHCPHEAARAHRVTHGLIYADPLRQVYIAAHMRKRSRQNADDDEIRARERLLQGTADFKRPLGCRVGMRRQHRADFLIALRRLAVNVVQSYRAADLPVGNNVAHEPPRPSARAAADISYGQTRDLVTLMRTHGNSPPCWLIFSLYRHDSTDARVLQCAKEIHLFH